MRAGAGAVPSRLRLWWRAIGAVVVTGAVVLVTVHAFATGGNVEAGRAEVSNNVPPGETLPPIPVGVPAPTEVTTSPAPLVIPPAPSTTTGTVDPPTSPDGHPELGAPSALVPQARMRSVSGGQGSPVPVVNDPSVVATSMVPQLPLFASPGAPAPELTLANPTAVGTALVVLVKSERGPWTEVYQPVRPNGSSAWVPSADVVLSLVASHIVVNLSARRLTLYVDNAAVFTTPVAPGSPRSPTPTGSFFVTEVVRLSDPTGPYGPYALALSAFSNTYQTFEGGPGQIALHGTDQPWLIGSYASNGCVRLPNAAVAYLAQNVAAGTPVEIGD